MHTDKIPVPYDSKLYCTYLLPTNYHLLTAQANQHTRELITARKTSHKYNNKDLSRLR